MTTDFTSTETPPDAAGDDDHWSGEELEAAYLRALDALEAVESEVVASAEAVAPGRFEELSATADEPLTKTPMSAAVEIEDAPPVSAEQIVEACLFVGGSGLTAAKLAGVLRGDYTAAHVDQMIEQLNRQYLSEARPYEVRLGEGGYRLAVRDEYEPIRHKVYGLGPREVKLTQDALEVLSLIAYHQPLTEAALTDLGRPQANAVLRLLLRRDLIAVERPADQPKTVQYVTTPRFLSLFGINSLQELPHPEDLPFK